MKFKFLVVFPLFIFLSCSENSDYEHTSLDVIKEIYGYSAILDSKDINKVKNITTTEGLLNLLEFSDSLKNDDFIQMLSDDLVNNKITYSVKNDSVFEIRTGNKTGRISDLPCGLLIFKKVGKKYKINKYEEYTLVQ